MARLEKTEKPDGNGNTPEGARVEEAKELANSITAAIGDTFQSIANSSKPNMATASEDDLDKADETNKKGVRNRFLEMAAKNFDSPEDIPATYGLTGWPGSSGISGTVEGKRIGTAGGTIFNGEHSWENEFHLGDMGETTAEERNIYALKARAEGAQALAETCETYREGLLAGADSLDKAYEEAMAAYKAKTAPPTPPGSMVKTTI